MTHRFGSICITLVLLAVVTPMAPAQWTDWQDAEYVLGQPSFIWDYWGCTSTRLGFGGSYGTAIDLTNGKLYVADISNNRVLRFAYPLTGNEPIAELVFGQAVMTSGSGNRGGSPAANTMKSPWGVAVYNGDLWVAESGNNRVTKYSAAWSVSSNGPSATVVLGQSDFSTTATGTSSSKMNSPAGICFDASGNLWVVDKLNNRVLEFVDASNKASGASADRVLGQPDFASQSAPDPPTGSSLSNPTGVCADGTTLWVVDKDNSRVLRYDNAALKTDGAAADGVLGQSGFASKTAGTTATTLNLPEAADVDGAGRLYVGDRENNRVLIYNDAKSKNDGGDADNVLGQFDMVSAYGASSRNRFYYPSLIEADKVNGKLLVGDKMNNRVLQFSASGPLPVQLASFVASSLSGGVRLAWKTLSEVNNYGFDVERRSDNGESQWSRIGFVQGNGTSNATHIYDFTDIMSYGKFLYRLKQIDLDGSIHYSEALSVELATTGVAEAKPLRFALEQNYPNPFNPSTTIRYGLPNRSQVTLTVFNALGQQVALFLNGEQDAGYHEVQFDGSKLASGVYFYRLHAGNFVETRKLLVVR